MESKTPQALIDEAKQQLEAQQNVPPVVVAPPPAVVAPPPAAIPAPAPAPALAATAASPAAVPGQNLTGFTPGSNLAGFGSFGGGTTGRLYSDYGGNIAQMAQPTQIAQQPVLNLKGVNPLTLDKSLLPLWWQQNMAT
jgi:hypothetical protein